jgi:hypothetical protein
MNWSDLAQDRDWWRALMNSVTFRFHEMLGSSQIAAQMVTSQDEPRFMKLVS